MRAYPAVCGLLLLATAVCVACGDPPDSTDQTGSEAASTDTTRRGADPPDSLPVDSVAGTTDRADELGREDPFAGFQLEAMPDATAESRRIALLLRNLDTRLAVVYANGGAGEVLLDSVAGGTDARIDIHTRATSIMLRSMAPDGDTLRTTEVTAGPDSVVLEVIVAGSSADPEAAP